MKTKFFKKLSLVLVVAMVLSLFVPAAGVFAASKPSLNSDNKYLHLSGNPGPNEYNFNIKNKKKGWSYQWESKDESIAVVNEKNGVTTAKAVGKTTVYVVITDKDGEEVDTLEAKVTVRDNIKEVTIKNPVEKLAVGEAHDYNRSFVTESGSTKKTDSITRWTVEPSDTAEIDDKGVFVATAGGEYTITARSFQSKARHKSWTNDPEKYADYVLDSDTTKVVVSANIVDVKQVNKTKFTVEFDSSMADTDLSKDTAMVYQIINGKQYNTGTEKIKSLELDATGKIATVEIYGNLYSKAVYQFAYGDLKDEFTAASTDVSEITAIVFEDFQVKTDGSSVNMLDKVTAINADGVAILTGHDLSAYLTFEYKGEYQYGWINGTLAYINKDGYAGKVIVKYNNFIYDEATKTYKTVALEDDAMAMGVAILLNNTTMQYAVVKSSSAPDKDDSSKWSVDGFKVPAGEIYTYFIHNRYKRNTDNPWDGYTLGGASFKYVTTNSDLLVISGNSLYAVRPGVVTVLVQDPANNNATVGAFDITIVEARSYQLAEIDTNSVSLGNYNFGTDSPHNESRRFVVTNKDSMGEAVLVSPAQPEYVNGPAGNSVIRPTVTSSVETDPASGDFGKAFINVHANGATKGAYQYKVDLTALNSTKTVTVFINVLDGSVANANEPEKSVVRWNVELSGDVDLKKIDSTKSVSVNVYGYNGNNARIFVLDAADYTLTVNKVNTSTSINSTFTKNSIPVAWTSGPALSAASGGAFEFVEKASYLVTAYSVASENDPNPTGRANGIYINAAQFTVSDSTELVVVRDNPSVSVAEANTVEAAIKKAFNFKINGGDIDEATASFTYKVTRGGSQLVPNATVAEGDNLHVIEVKYTTSFNNGPAVTYTFNVNQGLTITK